jgi:hypothetical protein
MQGGATTTPQGGAATPGYDTPQPEVRASQQGTAGEYGGMEDIVNQARFAKNATSKWKYNTIYNTKPLSDKHLREISEKVRDWNNLATQLEYTDAQIENLAQAYSTQQTQGYNMLILWKNSQDASLEMLIERLAVAFVATNENDLLKELRETEYRWLCMV